MHKKLRPNRPVMVDKMKRRPRISFAPSLINPAREYSDYSLALKCAPIVKRHILQRNRLINPITTPLTQKEAQRFRVAMGVEDIKRRVRLANAWKMFSNRQFPKDLSGQAIRRRLESCAFFDIARDPRKPTVIKFLIEIDHDLRERFDVTSILYIDISGAIPRQIGARTYISNKPAHRPFPTNDNLTLEGISFHTMEEAIRALIAG